MIEMANFSYVVIYSLTCIILFVQRRALSLQVKSSSYTGLRLDPLLQIFEIFVHIFFFDFLPLLPPANPLYSQVSPLFQKLEVDQIEALKKRFGGQQVFDVYEV